MLKTAGCPLTFVSGGETMNRQGWLGIIGMALTSVSVEAQTYTGKVTSIEFKVEALPSGTPRWQELTDRNLPKELQSGDQLKTGRDSRARVDFRDGSHSILKQYTLITLRGVGAR